MSLKIKVARLIKEKPHLKRHLMPLLKEAWDSTIKEVDLQAGRRKDLKKIPGAIKKALGSLSYPKNSEGAAARDALEKIFSDINIRMTHDAGEHPSGRPDMSGDAIFEVESRRARNFLQQTRRFPMLLKVLSSMKPVIDRHISDLQVEEIRPTRGGFEVIFMDAMPF